MTGQPNLKKDKNLNVVQESYLSDMKFRGEYSASNLIYRGFARPGSATADSVWQICKITYSGSDVTQIDWPQINGSASSEFLFIWDNRGSYSYS
jgi:hypothetical protein